MSYAASLVGTLHDQPGLHLLQGGGHQQYLGCRSSANTLLLVTRYIYFRTYIYVEMADAY